MAFDATAVESDRLGYASNMAAPKEPIRLLVFVGQSRLARLVPEKAQPKLATYMAKFC